MIMRRFRTWLLGGALLGTALAPAPGLAAAKGQWMSKKDLIETVSEQVKAALPSELLLDDVALPRGFEVPRGSVVDVVWRKPPAEGNAWVLVSASLDAKVKRRGFVKVQLVAIRRVLVAQRALSKGEIIGDDDLVAEPRVGVKGIGLAAVALLGAPVLADVEEGAVVTGASIGLPAPVARGTSISVISRFGRVQVAAQGRLETTARPGEAARARIIATHRIVDGQLVDEHTLIVGEGVSP